MKEAALPEPKSKTLAINFNDPTPYAVFAFKLVQVGLPHLKPVSLHGHRGSDLHSLEPVPAREA